MYGQLPPNGFIENTPDAFAEKAVFLYENKNIWHEKQYNGFNVINTRFNKSASEQRFAETLNKLTANYTKNRHNNFIGQMLQHHTLQSTKYMSKWIEAKHKTP